eukprot:GHVS01062516.1.p1 GENE.GHVS01062516.1~~GHVS01062516.1.p1  ORF type:complete len:936 (+),score=181.54 GHVS01062516.1:25-2808(+)
MATLSKQPPSPSPPSHPSVSISSSCPFLVPTAAPQQFVAAHQSINLSAPSTPRTTTTTNKSNSFNSSSSTTPPTSSPPPIPLPPRFCCETTGAIDTPVSSSRRLKSTVPSPSPPYSKPIGTCEEVYEGGRVRKLPSTPKDGGGCPTGPRSSNQQTSKHSINRRHGIIGFLKYISSSKPSFSSSSSSSSRHNGSHHSSPGSCSPNFPHLVTADRTPLSSQTTQPSRSLCGGKSNGLAALWRLLGINNSSRPSPSIGSKIVGSGRIHYGCIWDIYDKLDVVLGSGFSGPVKLIVSKHTSKPFAVKSFTKKGASSESLLLLLNEATICLSMDHPNIARLVDLYESREEVHLVMEYCSGRQLYDRLATEAHYTEDNAAEATHDMLQALLYLHSHNVIHRDIKLENWLYENETPSAKLKLIDFGFSKLWSGPRRCSATKAVVGTIYYIPPEVLQHAEYTTAVDMWALGVVVFMMLSGHPPFYSKSRHHTIKQIVSCSYSMTEQPWLGVSEEAKDFVRCLLCYSPARRLSARQALDHPWMQRKGKARLPPAPPIDSSVLESMRRFSQFHQLKRAAMTVLAYGLTSDEIGTIRDIFLAFDTTGRGTIRLEDFAEVMRKSFEWLSVHEIQNLFQRMDTSCDEEIEYTEFIAAVMQARVHMHKGIIRRAFEKIDIEGAGYVTIRQLREVIGGAFSASQLREAVKALDLHGDGRINYDEFIDFIQDEGQGAGEQSKRCLHSTLSLLDKYLHDHNNGGGPQTSSSAGPAASAATSITTTTERTPRRHSSFVVALQNTLSSLRHRNNGNNSSSDRPLPASSSSTTSHSQTTTASRPPSRPSLSSSAAADSLSYCEPPSSTSPVGNTRAPSPSSTTAGGSRHQPTNRPTTTCKSSVAVFHQPPTPPPSPSSCSLSPISAQSSNEYIAAPLADAALRIAQT